MVFMWIVISIKVVFLGICNILKGDKQKIASGFLGFVNIIFQYLKKGKAKIIGLGFLILASILLFDI